MARGASPEEVFAAVTEEAGRQCRCLKSPARMSELLCMQSGRLWLSKTCRLI
jgi:hypothetical protein